MIRGDELTITIDGFALEGKGVARADGFVLFVSGGVPGDVMRIRLTKTKKSFAEAEIVEILSPSVLRVPPLCRHFGVCGGCMWQHVGYNTQLEFKRQHVADALERIGGFKGITVSPALGAQDPYFYRNKMEFSFGNKWLTKEEVNAAMADGKPASDREQFALGLHIPQRFDKVLDIDECWLQSEMSYGIVNAVRSYSLEHSLSVYSTFHHTGYLRNLVIRQSKHTGELMVNIVTSDDNPRTILAMKDMLLGEFPLITTIINNITEKKSQVAIGEREKVYYGPGFITERIGARTYRISANSFFQTNTLQAERLYDTVKRLAGLTRSDVVFDLYSGTGTIALSIADDVREVVGIESVEAAVVDAEKNAAMNGVHNCTFLLGDLKDRLTQDTAWRGCHPRPDVVIVDPPRAGMHEKVVREVLGLHPRTIIYVSCNPGTQARDLKILCEGGEYVIGGVQPVDMFPHTNHVENVVSLSLAPM